MKFTPSSVIFYLVFPYCFPYNENKQEGTSEEYPFQLKGEKENHYEEKGTRAYPGCCNDGQHGGLLFGRQQFGYDAEQQRYGSSRSCQQG